MWRARHARIIDAAPPITRPVAFARAWFRRTPLPRLLLLTLALGWGLPMAIFWGGIVVMAAAGINPG